jgi:hypothetical protein
MKTSLREALQRLTLRQQRRIWLIHVSNKIPATIWWSASVLFSGGMIHQLWFPLSRSLMLCIAILPSLLLLAWTAVTKKPTTDEGAADADRLLGANSLFVSAWELSRSRMVIDGVGALLLARAEDVLPNWHQNFDTPTRSISTANLTAAALACLGLFFLLMPTHVQIDSFTDTVISRPGEPTKQSDEPVSVLSDLLGRDDNTAPEDGSQFATARDRQAASRRVSPQRPPEDAPADMADISAERLQTMDQSPPGQSTSPAAADPLTQGVSKSDGKKIPRRTPGSGIGNTSDRMMSKSAGFAQLSLIDIDVNSDSRSTAFSDRDKDGGLLLPASSQSAIHPSAIRRSLKSAQTISNNLLTVEQRALAGRYFKQLEKIDESNE